MPPELVNELQNLVAALRSQQSELRAINENTRPERGSIAALNKVASVFSTPGPFGPGGATNALATQMGNYQKNFNEIQKAAIAMGRDFKSINSTAMIQGLEDSYGATIAMQAALEAFNAGVGFQSKSTLDLAAEMKATGQNSAAMLSVMRDGQTIGNISNSEMNGLSEKLLSTSKQYGISADNLVKSMNTLSGRMGDFGALGLGAEMQKVMVDMTAKYGAGSEKIVGAFLDKITKGDNLANLQKLGIAEDVVAFGLTGTADQLEIIAQKASGAMTELISQMESGVISKFQALRMAEDIYGEEGKLAILVAGLERQKVTALGTTDATDQTHVALDKLNDSFYILSPLVATLTPAVAGLSLGFSMIKAPIDMATGGLDLLESGLESIYNNMILGSETFNNFSRSIEAIALKARIVNEIALADPTMVAGMSASPRDLESMGRTELSDLGDALKNARTGATTSPTARVSATANGNVTPQEARAILHAASLEKRMMPAGSNLAVANTSEAIIPMSAGNASIVNNQGMMGTSVMLTALTGLTSQLTEGNNKIVQVMSIASTALTTLVTLQQASQMMGGAGGIGGMLSKLLPSLLPVLGGFLPMLLPILLGGGAIALITGAFSKKKEEVTAKVDDRKQITTNEYMRVSNDVGKALFNDTIQSQKDNSTNNFMAKSIATQERGNEILAGLLRNVKNHGVMAATA